MFKNCLNLFTFHQCKLSNLLYKKNIVCFIKLLFLDKNVVNIFENNTIGALWFNLYTMWNSLNNNIRNVDTLSKFKSELKKIDETENHSVPKHFFCGPRKLNIILTQLRNSASFLNFDLFRVGIVSDPSCRCGAALENLKHFFLDCPIYIQARTILISNINRVTTCYTLDIEFLTCGNDNLTYEQNCIIFKYVFDYIKCSKRFLIV